MLFSKRIKEKEKIIMEFDEKINHLQEQKTSLAVDIERQRATYNNISAKIKCTNDYLNLEEQIESSKNTLNNLNGEIEKSKRELAKLKEDIKLRMQDIELIDDYTSLNELNQKLRESSMQLIDEKILEIKKRCPNVKFSCLDFSNKGISSTASVKYVINAELTKFAIAHNIDPMYYKTIICTYNSEWFKEFDKVEFELIKRVCFDASDLIDHPLLKCFVILEENMEE